jgi:hypothetical protein
MDKKIKREEKYKIKIISTLINILMWTRASLYNVLINDFSNLIIIKTYDQYYIVV